MRQRRLARRRDVRSRARGSRPPRRSARRRRPPAATRATIRKTSHQRPCSSAARTRYHLLMKPAVPGTPISDSPQTTMPRLVSGIAGRCRWTRARREPPSAATDAAEQHEDRALGDAVVEQVDDRRGQAGRRAERQAEDDVADLGDARVGEQPLQVGLEDGDRRGAEHAGQRQQQQHLLHRQAARRPATGRTP